MVIVLPSRNCLVYHWLYRGRNNNMKVKDLIKHLKKMPQTKQVLFFNHDTETLLNLDDGAWNVPNTKWVEGGKKGTYVNHVEIAGRYTGEGHNVWVESKQQASKKKR